MSEKIIQTKICKHCNIQFDITDKDLEYYEKVCPIFGGKKYSIPTPTICPECRQKRRLSFRNERSLYKGICDATGKPMVSIFSPDKPYKVYNHDYWWSDNWNPLDYGVDFDFNRPFFEQYFDLVKRVPKISLVVGFNSNCEYVNFAGNHKNCYLIFDSDYCEDSMFSNVIKRSNKLLDCSFSMNSELMYECVDCDKGYNLKYSINSINCRDSNFLFNCVGCNNCYGCTNLVNKQYYVFNKPYSKQEYEEFINKLNFGKQSIIEREKQNFYNIIKKSIVKSTTVLNSQNYSGNYISNSKNILNSYDIGDAEDCKYCDTVYIVKDCYDISSFGESVEKSYEGETIGVNAYNILFSFSAVNASDIYYSQFCWSVKNLFGCAGLHSNQQYCILNKQYTKQEYEDLVPKIIEHMKKTGEWGEFFPSRLSLFGYNETMVQEYFPLTKHQAIKEGYNWSDYEQEFPKVERIIPANKLPDNIKEIPDDILNRAIKCEITKRPYRIIKQELEFYRKNNLPIPRKHPDQRHLERMSLRNPRKLFDRKCAKCGIGIQTTYSQDREEIVYCEKCYDKEIY